ncbi:ISAon1 family transposase N-terminal region protein [Chryseobacterium arachidis]
MFLQQCCSQKGFVPEITVDDFSAPRKKTVKLHIKRRRWTDVKKTGNIIQRNWDLIAKGTRMTTDFCRVLKNQPILKLYPAKSLAKCMAWMVRNFKDSTNKASAISRIGNKKITCARPGSLS